MKRFVLFISLFALLTLSGAWLANAAAISISVKNSKHNLQYKSTPETGTGPIKASVDKDLGGTSEICVFCHTPHSGNTQAPLWNKTASVGSYSTYTSDVLAGLGYWPAEDPKSGAGIVPHVKTRICLSCHDGTIALGSLVNMPFGAAAQIPMEGTTGGNMPAPAAGYIGLELKDDHPVAIKHDTSDPDLTSIPLSAKVRLYRESDAAPTKANLDYVECTSCHDPHDNQWGNFLIESNQNSALCYVCHNKGGFFGSAHDDNSVNVGYAPPTEAPAASGNPANHGPRVGDVKCINCHFVHKAGVSGMLTTSPPTASPNPGYGKYLLSFQEEKTCFNNPDRWGGSTNACHASSGLGKDIQTTIINNLSSAHRVGSIGPYSGRHNAAESRGSTVAGIYNWTNNGTAWHVECEDCHNPHTSGRTLHTPGGVNGNAVPLPGNPPLSPLSGTGGVSLSPWPGAWTAPTAINYTYVEPKGLITAGGAGVTKEYEICLKCHSSFAWGATPPASPPGLTDQAKEFNPANASFHPVAGATGRNVGTHVGTWNLNKGTQTMYCSDCHNNSAASPQGSHGSGNNFILAKAFDDTSAAGGKGTYQLGTDLCFSCHDPATYLTGAGVGTGFLTVANTNLHTKHYTDSTNGVSNFGYKCVNCHIRVPHGWNARRAMVIIAGDAPGSVYQLATGPSITGFGVFGWPASGGYQDGLANKNANCMTVSGCHQ